MVVGYGAYLAYSLLILPLSVMLYFALKGREASPLLAVAAAVGVVSALARALGIVRWLFLMPFLAGDLREPLLGPGDARGRRGRLHGLQRVRGRGRGAAGRGAHGRRVGRPDLGGAAALGAVPEVARRCSACSPPPLLLPGLLSVAGLDVGSLFAVVGGNVLLIWMLALAVVLFRRVRSPGTPAEGGR